MKLGDGKLPPFIGYLPPGVDGLILELLNMSYKDYPPRRGRTGAQLSQDRKLAIESLWRHFKQKPHQRAVGIVAAAMKGRRPFCLYLRNFGLGPRVYPARNDPFGLPQVVTMASGQFDLTLQRRIQEIVSPTVPALSIRNPAGDGGEMPAFIVGDGEWAELARTLVRNAGLIVMYFLSLTSGVAEELELIRSAGKQNTTLVVTEEGNPFKDGILEAVTGAQRSEPPPVPAQIEDFPHQVSRKDGGDWSAVDAKLAELAQRDLPAPVDTRIGLPVELVPPEPLRNHCTDRATEAFDAASKLIAEKRYEEAEDLLTRAIAYAHWGRDTLGRAMALAALGRLNIVGFQAKGDAGAYYELALDVCGEIRGTSKTAAELYPAIEQSLERLKSPGGRDIR